MLTCFMSTSHRLESFWKRGFLLRECLRWTGFWASLWCILLIGETWVDMANCEQCDPCAGGPGQARRSKPGGASQEGTLFHVLRFGSCFRVPVLFEFLSQLPSAIEGNLSVVSWNKVFLPRVVYGRGFIVTITETWGIQGLKCLKIVTS